MDPSSESASSAWFQHEHLQPDPTPPPAGESSPVSAKFVFIPAPRAENPEQHWPPDVRRANAIPKNRFGHFVLVEQVGCGDSGTVFRAWDSRWKQYAAVKILHRMEGEVLDRFTHEAPLVAHLRHPSIAGTYEAGEHDGQWYVAMTYIEGRPADAGTRSVELNVELVRDAARALDFAHNQGIAHGDLKPSNVLVDPLDRIFVTDFGVPSRLAQADAHTDVYGLGALLYHLLSGGETSRGRPLTRLNPQVSPALERVISKAMARNPGQRFDSAGELADELDRLLVEGRFTGPYGRGLALARKWAPIAAGAIALAALFSWLAPTLAPAAAHAAPAESNEARYRRASLALMRIEESDEPAAQIRDFLKTETGGLAKFSPAEVLKARALLFEGKRQEARRELAALVESEPGDYRVRYLRTLLDFEEALAEPLPLPAPEAPTPQWDGPVPDWRRFQDDLSVVARASVPQLLQAEHRRDADAAQGLLALAEGQWRAACEKLTAVTQSQRLPVYIAARRAAAYLARRFDEVLDDPGTQFAMALESGAAPAENVKRLRSLFRGDAGREATLYCWAARKSLAHGVDPTTLADEGLAVATGKEPRGILQVAKLRWLGYSGTDSESGYREARENLGDRPATWMGRLADIEGLLGLARHRKLRGEDGNEELQEALARINTLPDEPGWAVPHLLRAEALFLLGRLTDSLQEAGRVDARSEDGFRAILISAASLLRLADRARESGDEGGRGLLEDAIACSDRALSRHRNHPEALTLKAAAAVFAAETDRDSTVSLMDAIRRLTAVLDRVPASVEARFHRASAYYILAERAAGGEPGFRNAAIADLDRVLLNVPELSAARELRRLVGGDAGAEPLQTAASGK